MSIVKHFVVCVGLLFFAAICFAEGPRRPSSTVVKARDPQANEGFVQDWKTLEQALLRYKAAALVELKFNKTVKSELMNRQTTESGTAHFAKGKVRLSIQDAQNTLIVFDRKNLWTQQTQPKELGGETIVSRVRVSGGKSQSMLLSQLFEEGKIRSKFLIQKMERTHSEVRFDLIPKDQSDLGVKFLQLVLQPQQSEIKKFSYTDDVGNTTTFDMEKTDFLGKPNARLFSYQPPKGIKVNEL